MAAFTIQHIDDYDVPSTGGSQTLTAVNMSQCVVLNTNSNMISAGPNGNTVAPPGDEISVGIDLTSTTNVNFDREAAAAASTRCSAAAWEYTGSSGGPNEFLVRSRGTASIAGGNRTTTATCTTTPTDIDDCVVFITGILSDRTDANRYHDMSLVAWLSGTNTINFERGGTTSNVEFYYTVVEFTGSNWTIHHAHSGDVTGDTGSLTLYDSQKGTGTTSTVAAWNKAFIYGLFKGDDSALTNNDACDVWPVYDPGTGTGTVDWTFDALHTGADNQHLVYVIENDDTSFSVARYNTGAITLPSGDQTTTITAVTSLSEALCLCTCEDNTNNTAFARGHRNAGFNSTTEVYGWCHRANGTGQIEYQVIDFSGMAESAAVEVSAGVDALTLTKYNTTVTLDVPVSANVDNLTLTELNTSITADTVFTANFDALTLTGYNATSGLTINVDTTVDQLSLTSYNTTVDADISFTAGLDALTLTALNVSVNIGQGIEATLDQLTLTTFNTSISADISFTANIDNLTLTAYNADASFGFNVFADVSALSLTPYNASILYAGLVEQNATDDDKKHVSERSLRAVELVYKEYVSIRRQRVLNALKMLEKQLRQ